MHPVSTEVLEAEIERLAAIAYVCKQYGEADGENAANSQLRALRRELDSRKG
jgi:hypothetical protein